MPVSRTGHLYFTDAQYQAARAYGALEYARAAGYDLIRDGNSYHLRQHDSMVFTLDGRWFWNSRGLRGRALEFMVHYEGRTLPEAVNRLSGEQFSSVRVSPRAPPPEKKPFELPERSPSFKRLFAYLCKTRGLDYTIVQDLVRQGRIYESIRTYESASYHQASQAHNVVFVSFDETGHPRAAYQRGTNTSSGSAFKRDVPGSDKQYPFLIPGHPQAGKVSVFEAAIDAISHASLIKLSGGDWQSSDRIALGGVAPKALLHYLGSHTEKRHIELCLDNDQAGRAAEERLTAQLLEHGYTPEHGYTITAALPDARSGKDWNDHLIAFQKQVGKRSGH